VIVPTLSVCGVACVEGLEVDSRVGLSSPTVCDGIFRGYQELHPSAVCGQAYEVLPGSRCVGTVIVGAFLALACTAVCSESPDLQACALECLLRELELEGNCLACYVQEAVDFRLCVLRPGLTPEDVGGCLSQYIVESGACSP